MKAYVTVAEVMERWSKRDAQHFRNYWLPKFKGVRKLGRAYLIPFYEVVRVEKEHVTAPSKPSVAKHSHPLGGVQG